MKTLTLVIATVAMLQGCNGILSREEPKPVVPAGSRPNIVFMMVDDMGYADLSCYGAPDAKTPNIDALANQGVKFTQFYANGAECTPTRAALMTGRYPQRVKGLECAIGTGNVGRYDDAIELANNNNLGLQTEDAVIPKLLKEQNYTSVMFGKWHLGYEPKFNPVQYGWDRFFGVMGGNCHYFTHAELSELPVLYINDKPVERNGYMTHLIANDAVSFIHNNRKRHFFLYVPFTTPHFPFQAPGDENVIFTKENWMAGTRQTYVKMLEDMDRQVGRILDAIKGAGLDEKTVVVFCSDHGAMKPGLNTPFNGYKGGLFEGGIRAPLIVRWPGKIKPNTTSHQVCMTMDLTKSFLRIGGAKMPGGVSPDGKPLSDVKPLDGIDIIAHAEQRLPEEPRTVFWRARRGDRTWKAVRDKSLKYIWKTEGGKVEHWMFNLETDAGETNNLIGSQPADLLRLQALLAQWENEMKPEIESNDK